MEPKPRSQSNEWNQRVDNPAEKEAIRKKAAAEKTREKNEFISFSQRYQVKSLQAIFLSWSQDSKEEKRSGSQAKEKEAEKRKEKSNFDKTETN